MNSVRKIVDKLKNTAIGSDAVGFLNDAAFGDIREAFNRNAMSNFFRQPIGLFQRSYGFAMKNLMRNIGNADFGYDGFGDPIGSLVNPNYATEFIVPWFIGDYDKSRYATYLDYVKNIYGSTLSVDNINDKTSLQLNNPDSTVGVIDRDRVKYLINSNPSNPREMVSYVNPNGRIHNDTTIGRQNSYFSYISLSNSINYHDKEAKDYGKTSITKGLYEAFGLRKGTVENDELFKDFTKKSGDDNGRLNVPNVDYYAGHKYGDDDYSEQVDKLSDNVKGYLHSNVHKNKYYARYESNGDDVESYFDEIGFDGAGDDSNKRYSISRKSEFANHVNLTDAYTSHPTQYVYGEAEGSSEHEINGSYNDGIRFGTFKSYGQTLKANDLLKKTNDLFRENKMGTLISRFKTGLVDTDSTTQTSVSKVHGMSHGRNLLKPESSTSSAGYENPYCRVWTNHHQYRSLADTMRGSWFGNSDHSASSLYSNYNFSAFTADHGSSWGNGRERLAEHGVLNMNNALVNIAPKALDNENRKVDIRNCMFSIENLAWKDMFSTDSYSRSTFQRLGLSPEQKGPFGGRIMWFPPYGLKFSEQVDSRWKDNEFIGRGEPIYTYTNTTRKGTLDFTILVDHPAIVDYWERRGDSSTEGGVDDITSDEQTLLRFFAGCDVLSAMPKMPKESQVSEYIDEILPIPNSEKITFNVFYPNNYSGQEDKIDFAINYLLGGLGAGVIKNEVTGKYEDYPSQLSLWDGGYEVRENKPISVVSTQEGDNLHICDANGFSLYVMQGKATNVKYQRKWYYRVDGSHPDGIFRNEILKQESYLDTKSFGLNSSHEVVARELNKEEDNLYSFVDVYLALSDDSNAMEVLSDVKHDDKIAELKNKIQGKKIVGVSSVGYASVQGNTARVKTNDTRNDTLQVRRAKTPVAWLKTTKYGNQIEYEYLYKGGTGGDRVADDVNDISNKKYRRAEVTLYIASEGSTTVQNTLSERNVKIDGEDEHQTNFLSGDLMASMQSRQVYGYSGFKDNSANKFTQLRAERPGLKVLPRNALGIDMDLISYDEDSFLMQSLGGQRNFLEVNNEFKNIHGAVGEVANEYSEAIIKKNYTDYIPEEEVDIDDGIEGRYDNESRFFEMLAVNDPMMHHKITEKIKYFDPAFHSITPEGFNARLTFLHQCTRQGPTIAGSDERPDSTANNLSFGRPPVCILRIGDFYYTKIIIRSLNINFDPLVWDLNAEGIGVMPMMANVSISFDFIGGSSLAGHITRLQNALSFNYYANTEVYDNRAELAEYNEDGILTDFKPFNPKK